MSFVTCIESSGDCIARRLFSHEFELEADKYEANLNKVANKLARRSKMQELNLTKNLNPKNLRETLAKRKAEMIKKEHTNE